MSDCQVFCSLPLGRSGKAGLRACDDIVHTHTHICIFIFIYIYVCIVLYCIVLYCICENFTLVLIAAVACDFTVILHKDDTHKSTEIPLQFHSAVDELSMYLRPFYGSKEPQLHCTCFLRMVAEPGVVHAWLF